MKKASFVFTAPLLFHCVTNAQERIGAPPVDVKSTATAISPEAMARLKTLWKQGADAKHRGDYEGARRAWQRALQVAPEHPGFRESIDKLPQPVQRSVLGDGTPKSLPADPAAADSVAAAPSLSVVKSEPRQGARHEQIPIKGLKRASVNRSQLRPSPPPSSLTPRSAPPAINHAPESAPAELPAQSSGVRPAGYRPPPGHTRSLTVPKAAQAPVIDGKLDEAGWKNAAHAFDFWVSEYGRAPREATEVWVVADDKALYFAFLCHDSDPSQIHAQQIKRDSSLGLDDQVAVQLDSYHDHRQVSDFAVNALGTQSDARAGGRSSNIAFKGDWQAATQRTAQGWTAEMAIPFGILNFGRGADEFGVNFVRYHHRTQEYSRWADVTPQFLAEEAGHLTGLQLPQAVQQNKLSLLQYATGGLNTPSKTGSIRKRLATTGFDLRYEMANNLTSVFSLNPDFSQVEDDVVGLGFDYNEKFRTDGRPFFQEGSAFFPSRNYFYSRRVPNFDFGLKSFGKIGPFQLGFLGAQAPQGRRDYAVRLLREIGPTLNLSLLAVGSERADFDNRLLALQAGGRFKRNLVFGADLATTSTQGRAGDGAQSRLSLSYQAPYWQAGAAMDRIDKGFFPANGLIADDVLGTHGRSVFYNYSRDYGEGRLRSVNGSVSYDGRDTMTGLVQRRKYSAYIGGETRSNIAFNLGTTVGPYRPRGKNPGEWSNDLNNDRFYTASAYFDTRSDRHGYGLTYSWGFLGGGDYSDLSPSFWLKPTRKTYLSYSHERAESFGITSQSIFSLSWDISREQSLSLRRIQSSGEFGGQFYRVAFRRQVRQGIDIFAVYNTDPFSPDRFTIKLVRAFGLR